MIPEEYYFNEKDAKEKISHMSLNELKEELNRVRQCANILLNNWSKFNDIEKLVKALNPDIELQNCIDYHYQTKCILSNRYVEYMKYAEFLNEYIDNLYYI